MEGNRGIPRSRIHDYFEIDLQVAWDTIELDLEPLAKAVREYLEAHP